MKEQQFFVNGSFVCLEFLEQVVKKENGNKTINELLDEFNLNENKHYILNPSLLISSLYGTFLLYKEQMFVNNEKDEKIQQINNEKIQQINSSIEKWFDVKYNKNNYKVARAIRNALAHYDIDMQHRDDDVYFVFKDKDRKKGESNYHFEAEITYLNMRLLIEDLSKII